MKEKIFFGMVDCIAVACIATFAVNGILYFIKYHYVD